MINIKSEIKKWIIDNNKIPNNLIELLPISLLPIILNKIKSVIEFKKSIILTGSDSLQKDLTAVYFLLKYANLSKKIKYYSHPGEKLENGVSYATAIMRIELVKGDYNISILSEILTKIITENKIFIIGCDNIESLKKVFGKSFGNFLEDNSIEFVIPNIEKEKIKL